MIRAYRYQYCQLSFILTHLILFNFDWTNVDYFHKNFKSDEGRNHFITLSQFYLIWQQRFWASQILRLHEKLPKQRLLLIQFKTL